MSEILAVSTLDGSPMPQVHSFLVGYDDDKSILLEIYHNEKYSNYDFIYTDADGNGIFLEDFAHKREYLAFIKQRQKELIRGFYRLRKDFLRELDRVMQIDFLLYAGDTDDLPFFLEKERLSINFEQITTRTIFKHGQSYLIKKARNKIKK